MNSINRDEMTAFFRQSLHEFIYLIKKAAYLIASLPLHSIFIACIAIALIFTVLPLAISLFCLFLLLKIFSVGIIFAVRKTRRGSVKQIISRHD
ncbi:hypothetical protein KDM87_11925 [Undibacterium sp. FT147W]|uniref:Uncharacterized protein n=1 Tax=Undibacterium rivi TaxID=2828729 RepID=A0ABS5H3P2_9BURK|nr:hypothetical protein [Undibacterium rivi]MBR7793308.1 hypothetical protein [Undibacterium rivi]